MTRRVFTHNTLLKLGQNIVRKVTRHHISVSLVQVSSPFFLLVGKLQEPANIVVMVASSIGREEVSKETFHESTDSLVDKMETWSEKGGGENFDGYVGDVGQPGAI